MKGLVGEGVADGAPSGAASWSRSSWGMGSGAPSPPVTTPEQEEEATTSTTTGIQELAMPDRDSKRRATARALDLASTPRFRVGPGSSRLRARAPHASPALQVQGDSARLSA